MRYAALIVWTGLALTAVRAATPAAKDGVTLEFAPGAGVPAAWRPHEPWMADRARIEPDGPAAFLRVSGYAFFTADAEIDPAWAAVAVTAHMRVAGLEPGPQPWDAACVEVAFVDAAGKALAAENGWRYARADTPWQDQAVTVAVPAGARQVRVTVGNKSQRGDVDVRRVTVRPATPPPPPAAPTKPSAASVAYWHDASAPQGANVDESKIAATVYVDPTAAGASDDSPGTDAARPMRSFEAAVAAARRDFLDRGRGVRVRLAAGTHRVRRGVELTKFRGTPGADAVLIIEGEPGGRTVLSGSITDGLEPAQWTLVDAGKRLYRAAWPHNFGFLSAGYYMPDDLIMHRREMLFVNRRRMTPRIIERHEFVDPVVREYDERTHLVVERGRRPEPTGYVYRGYDGPGGLRPGEFAVAELGPGEKFYDGHPDANTIFLRLPDDVPSLDGATVEAGVTPRLMAIEGKHNLVLRDLVVQHFASHYNNYADTYAIETEGFQSQADTRNWLVEDCTFRDNNGRGLGLYWVHGVTVRRCAFEGNGCKGLDTAYVTHARFEDVDVVRNNWRGRLGGYALHGAGGASISLYHATLVRCRFNENFGIGFRPDTIGDNLVMEDCEASRNSGHGMMHEIQKGPVLLKNCRVEDNGAPGVQVLNVENLTLDGCTIAGNKTAQLSLYNMDGRTTQQPFGDDFGRQTPIGQIRRLTVRDSTIAARAAGQLLIERMQGVGNYERYVDVLKREYVGSGNRFWAPAGSEVFDVSTQWEPRALTDMAGWRAFTGQDADSTWAGPPTIPDGRRPPP